MICPSCNGEMRPLFTGFYCPQDCDRAGSAARPTGEVIPFEFGGKLWYAHRVDEVPGGEIWWIAKAGQLAVLVQNPGYAMMQGQEPGLRSDSWRGMNLKNMDLFWLKPAC